MCQQILQFGRTGRLFSMTLKYMTYLLDSPHAHSKDRGQIGISLYCQCVANTYKITRWHPLSFRARIPNEPVSQVIRIFIN